MTLMAGSISKLLGDKAYDSNSFRNSLRKDGITPAIPGRVNRKKRIVMTKKPIRIATSSSAAIAGSRISGALQRAMTSSPETSFPACAWLQRRSTGRDRIESGP
jgi:hypothetical protein